MPGATYTCPMHPEVVRDAPGNCPICGMALEPTTVEAESGPNPELVDFRRRFWVGLVLSLPLLVLAMGHMFGLDPRAWIPSRLHAWRSDERRVGKGWFSTCRSRWSPYT